MRVSYVNMFRLFHVSFTSFASNLINISANYNIKINSTKFFRSFYVNDFLFDKIVMNKKRNQHKNDFRLTKRLLDFIRLFKPTFLLFIFNIFEQTRQQRSYFRITKYKASIKVNKSQKYLHFVINFEFKLFFNHLNSFRIHSYLFCEYYKV